MVHPMTILCAFLATPSYISTTIFDKNFASSFRSVSTDNGPWGSSPKRQVVPDLLLGGVLSGGMYGAGVKVLVLLLCAYFELGVFSLLVKRSSRATCLGQPQCPSLQTQNLSPHS
jgi:hypothetical protein